MNQKKLRRLYREEKLQVRKRGSSKRALGTCRPMVLPSRANERWSLDFVSDVFPDGRRFRVLAVVDDCSREPGACGRHVIVGYAVDARVGRNHQATRQTPNACSDNGTEMISMAVLEWC